MSVKITGVLYYNPATGAYEAAPPEITTGQEGGIAVTVNNDTPLERDVTVQVTLTAPDASTSLSSDTKAIAAGASETFYFTFQASLAGEYSAFAGIVLGTKNFTNLLSNASFEEGSPPTGWTLSGAGATFARSTAHVYDGDYSGKLTRHGTACKIRQTVPLGTIAGHDVALSGQVYATVENRVRLRLIWSGANNDIYHSGVPGWERLAVTQKLPDTLTYLGAEGWVVGGDTTGWFDDLWLVEGDCSPGLVETFGPGVVATARVSQITQIVTVLSPLVLMGMMTYFVRGMFPK